jgi:murein L,D-transpeptidase YafK
MRSSKAASLTVLIALLIWSRAACADRIDGVDREPDRYRIEIHKAERLLLVRKGDTIERRYRIAWGRGGPGDKRRAGDDKTPTGVYRITGFNDSSKFYMFMRLNYPNVKDAFFGLKNKLISRAEFDRIAAAVKRGVAPPQNTALGGAIGIHGLGRETEKKLHIHRNLNWTEGCIALTNEEIRQLRSFVTIGTKVVILE